MARDSEDGTPRHPVRVVARRTGLSPHVLRAWERRYGAVEPMRAGSRRLYSDQEVERLSLLRRATLAGRSIGEVARLSTQRLRELVAADEAAAGAGRGPSISEPTAALQRYGGDPAAYVETALVAVRALDGAGLEAALARAAVAFGPPVLIDRVLVPLMRRIGDLWQAGALRVTHEHLASAVVHGLLDSLRGAPSPPAAGPALVVATPAGQRHDLGALVATLTATLAGWRVVHLGSDLPAEDIAAAARQAGARAVALSITCPSDEPPLDGELRRLRRELPDGVMLIVGGAGAEAYETTLARLGAVVLPDMGRFRIELGRLRGDGADARPAPI